MARYTGPRSKVSRRFSMPVFGPSKALDRKAYPPGQHGQRGRRKLSEYALALADTAVPSTGMMTRKGAAVTSWNTDIASDSRPGRLPSSPCSASCCKRALRAETREKSAVGPTRARARNGRARRAGGSSMRSRSASMPVAGRSTTSR